MNIIIMLKYVIQWPKNNTQRPARVSSSQHKARTKLPQHIKWKHSYYRIAGNFRGVQIFAFFEGRVVNAKIKTGINSHAPVYAGAKPIGGCGLLALTRKLKPRKFLLRALGAK